MRLLGNLGLRVLDLDQLNYLMHALRPLVFWYGGRLISQGYITAKAFTETFFVLVRTGLVISEAAILISELAKSGEVVGSLFAILERHTSIEPDGSNGYHAEEKYRMCRNL